METRSTSTAAIYARYSSEQQRETSLEDQARLCRSKAIALGAEVVAVRSDSAISGSTRVADRSGGRILLDDASAGRFDILLVESLDRLSRDLVEQETIIRRLEHRGIRIVGVSDGYDSNSGSTRKLARGVRGLINEAYLEDLRHKTHRGLAGQVSRGYHAGSVPYGYRSLPVDLNAKGEPAGYKLEVVPEQAVVVKRIFSEFASGMSCAKVAHRLNTEKVKGPRGGPFGVSVLYGTPNKGSGILNNELYIGRMIWNRSRWVKDPDTQKRTRVDRPQSEWMIVERPELRIVTDEEWALVRDRMGTNRLHTYGVKACPVKKTLLGGLLLCGKCGGPVIAVSHHAYGCANAKYRGPTACTGIRAPRKAIESTVTRHLREWLALPANAKRINQEMEQLAATARQKSTDEVRRRSRLSAHLEKELQGLVDAVASGVRSQAVLARMAATEAELDFCRTPPWSPAFDPETMSEACRHTLANLGDALKTETGMARLALHDVLANSKLMLSEDEKLVEVHLAHSILLVAP